MIWIRLSSGRDPENRWLAYPVANPWDFVVACRRFWRNRRYWL